MVFVVVGAGMGALHMVARGSGGGHVALTAVLSALIPVFAPVCFVPAVLDTRERGCAGLPVRAVRLGVIAGLGAAVAAVHLAVWEALAAGTGTIGGPSAADIPFMVVVVAVTSVVAAVAYEAPRRQRLAQPATVAAVVVLYAASFVVHGVLIGPSLAELGAKPGPGRLGAEVVAVVVSLAVVWLLMRREVRGGARTAGAVAARTAAAGAPTVSAGPGPGVA